MTPADRDRIIAKRLARYWFLAPSVAEVAAGKSFVLGEPGRLVKYNLTGCRCRMCAAERDYRRMDRRRDRHESRVNFREGCEW
jgi:hypothetical protein